MATESFVNVTEGSGKKLHTNQRTIGANAVADEYVLPGEFPLPGYFAVANAVAATTANDHLLQVMAGASLKVRIRRISVSQNQLATARGIDSIELWRLTTAGTGGTAVTNRPFDTADAAAGATAMTLPTAKGTESILLARRRLLLTQSVDVAQGGEWTWEQHPGTPAIVIPAGATNGLAIKHTTANAGAGYNVVVEFVETSF